MGMITVLQFKVKGKKIDVDRFLTKFPSLGFSKENIEYYKEAGAWKYSDGYESKSSKDIVEFIFGDGEDMYLFEFDYSNSGFSKMASLVPQLELSGNFLSDDECLNFYSAAGSDHCVFEQSENLGRIQFFILVNSLKFKKKNEKLEELFGTNRNSIIANLCLRPFELFESRMQFFCYDERNLGDIEYCEHDLYNLENDFKQLYLNLCNAFGDTEIKMYMENVESERGFSAIYLFNKLNPNLMYILNNEEIFLSDYIYSDNGVETALNRFDEIILNNEGAWEKIDFEVEQNDDFGE